MCCANRFSSLAVASIHYRKMREAKQFSIILRRFYDSPHGAIRPPRSAPRPLGDTGFESSQKSREITAVSQSGVAGGVKPADSATDSALAKLVAAWPLLTLEACAAVWPFMSPEARAAIQRVTGGEGAK
jgi:hypothetical protein